MSSPGIPHVPRRAGDTGEHYMRAADSPDSPFATNDRPVPPKRRVTGPSQRLRLEAARFTVVWSGKLRGEAEVPEGSRARCRAGARDSSPGCGATKHAPARSTGSRPHARSSSGSRSRSNGVYWDPSFWTRAITRWATDRPSASPTSTSVRKWIPAQIREVPASVPKRSPTPSPARPRPAVGRRVARMVRRREERRHRGIELKGTDRPVRELRVPDREDRVVVRDGKECVDPRRAGLVLVEVVLEDAAGGDDVPV